MPVKWKYKPNNKEFGQYMVSEEARQAPIDVAKDIATLLRITVKRSSRPGDHLADSYQVNESPPPVVIDGNPRVGAEVYSDHPGAAPDEFGGVRNKPKRWLGKTGAIFHVGKGKPE
jgi:hypothetical protein